MTQRLPDETTEAYHARLARKIPVAAADRRLYDALLRARENAREKDWPGDVATLQAHVLALFRPD